MALIRTIVVWRVASGVPAKSKANLTQAARAECRSDDEHLNDVADDIDPYSAENIVNDGYDPHR